LGLRPINRQNYAPRHNGIPSLNIRPDNGLSAGKRVDCPFTQGHFSVEGPTDAGGEASFSLIRGPRPPEEGPTDRCRKGHLSAGPQGHSIWGAISGIQYISRILAPEAEFLDVIKTKVL
jgi:hypothetical protein